MNKVIVLSLSLFLFGCAQLNELQNDPAYRGVMNEIQCDNIKRDYKNGKRMRDQGARERNHSDRQRRNRAISMMNNGAAKMNRAKSQYALKDCSDITGLLY